VTRPATSSRSPATEAKASPAGFLRGALAAMLLATVLLAGCASTPGSDSPEENDRRRAAELNTQLGREYMTRGQYEIAMEKLKRAVASDDDYAPAHTMLAVLYETLGEDQNAGRHFEAAVRAAPDNGDVNNNYGAFLCRTGKPERVDRYFLAALEDPFYQTPQVAMANAGSCAVQRGDFQQGETYLRQSLAYDPNFPDALFSLAALNYEQGELMRARAFLQRYDGVAEMSAESLLLGYRIETGLNNPEGARSYQLELMQQFPNAPEAAELQQRGRTTG
jgi:type IV pilus assembly protein PilF